MFLKSGVKEMERTRYAKGSVEVMVSVCPVGDIFHVDCAFFR